MSNRVKVRLKKHFEIILTPTYNQSARSHEKLHFNWLLLPIRKFSKLSAHRRAHTRAPSPRRGSHGRHRPRRPLIGLLLQTGCCIFMCRRSYWLPLASVTRLPLYKVSYSDVRFNKPEMSLELLRGASVAAQHI